uniref:Uncharacterized protein n=1 Tax=Ananas comosus var. bracteatus TaxID=296719 RepID=A0A6V7QYE4_ANACO
MASKSSANLLDGCSDDVFDFRQAVKSLPRVITAPGIITDVDEDTKNDEDLSSSRSVFSKPQSSLKVDIDPDEQENVAQKLLKELRCIPTFLSPELQNKFYHGFCKQQLWPLFHYMIPICLDKGELFDRSLFQAYVSANKTFADKVMEAINSDDDYVWVHDYHLMLLPTFLRKRLNQVKLGFFLHSPFPSAEIYRTLPVRDEILKSLLNSDVIGFQTFDYARHFLSCCSRMLGINYESKRGYIGLEYFGRTVSIKILPVGVHIGRLESVLQLPATVNKVREIEERYKGKTLLLGVDDMDIFKGISLKLLALELLLERNPKLRGGVVLVQIVNPARSAGKDVKEAREEAISIAERVNQCFGTANYKPVVLIDYPIPFYEKIAFYVAAECCIVNAVRDGMNLVPYEYIVCRQGTEEMDKCRGIDANFRHKSTLIVSEFVGCSPSLSGAFRVNPWCVEDVADAFYQATDLGEPEKQLRHEKHYRYEVVSGSHCSSYKKANRRAIFLDYDGTIMPESSISKIPSTDIISMLNNLCGDPKNTVFIVSGRGWTSLGEWFASCEGLGIAAEHGYFIRWSKEADWETKTKESALVWHYQYADHDFGSCQAKELLDHLESVLANEPVVVKRGQHIVEVKPQGVSKGLVVEKLIRTMLFFACTVGQKPSKAKYFVDDTSEVLKLLKRIAAFSTQNDNIAVSRVNFDMPLELAD